MADWTLSRLNFLYNPNADDERGGSDIFSFSSSVAEWKTTSSERRCNELSVALVPLLMLFGVSSDMVEAVE